MTNQIVAETDLDAIDRANLPVAGRAFAHILLHVRDFVRNSPDGKPIDTWTVEDIIKLARTA